MRPEILSAEFLNEIGEHFLAGHVRGDDGSPMLRYASGIREQLARTPLHIDAGRHFAPCAPFRTGAYCPIYNGLVMEWRLPELAEELRRTYGHEEGGTIAKALADYWRPYGADVMWQGHATLDYPCILANGLPSYAARIQAGLDDARKQRDARRTEFFRALTIVVEAIVELVGRYVAEFGSLAEKEASSAQCGADIWHAGGLDEIRRLEAARDAFGQILVGAPRTFYEALLFAHFFTAIDGFDNAGRLDQYLYPFYREDLERGRTSAKSAEDLFAEVFDIWGEAEYWNIVIGGTGHCGTDATNELTYTILRARGRVHRPKPSLSLRLSSTAPDELLDAAFETLLRGQGQPAIYNDDLYVRTLSGLDIPEESAREFVFGGCSETHIAGKSSIRDAFFNALQPLLTVLQNNRTRGDAPVKSQPAPRARSGEMNAMAGAGNGSSSVTAAAEDRSELPPGRLRGAGTLAGHSDNTSRDCRAGSSPATPSKQFIEFGALLEAYKNEVAGAIDRHVAQRNRTQRFVAEHQPSLIRSIFISGCIEKGISDSEGGAVHNHSLIDIYGIPNAANSLYVIKKLVFEDLVVSLETLLEALDKDFRGYEELRQLCLAQAKYGNDIDEVDALAGEISNFIFSYMQRHKIWNGGIFYGFCASAPGFHATLGLETGATPDGRLAGSPLGNSMGAVQGTDRSGPTALLNSVNKLDLSLAIGTPVVNLSFRREMFEGPNRKAVVGLIRTFFRRGGMQLQFNIVDREALRSALDHPEEHADLIVRVSGYSAYFTRLPRVLQEEIIERTLN